MSIIGIIVVLVVMGVVLWLINTYIPMQPPIKTIINIVVVLFLALWLLQVTGLLGPLNRPIVTR